MGTLLDHRLELSLWIALSLSLYSLSAKVAWRYRKPRPGRLGRPVESFKSWPYRHWPLQALRFLYYLAIPYSALLLGVTSSRAMGLTDIDWFKGIERGTILGLGGFFLLAFGWWYYARCAHRLRSPEWYPLSSWVAALAEPWGWSPLLLETIYLETHWAFYRSGPILLFDDYYLGVWLGFLLVGLEWYSAPHLRHGLSSPERAEEVLMMGGMAFLMAIIYFFIRNLWLSVLIHWGIQVGLLRLLGALYSPKPADFGPSSEHKR